MTQTRAARSLTGPELREMFAGATAWLERNRESVNAINVFPVPDGDTGTNMLLTMRATMEEAEDCGDESAGGMMAAISHGALMGARGNSGVILSQILRGFSRAVNGKESLDVPALAAAIEGGSAAAYSAVTKPVEGTILTVARESGEAARECVDSGAEGLAEFMSTVVVAARESVARTPTLLPVLAEAGVVDAGGQGLCVLFEGMLRHLNGEELPAEEEVEAGAIGQEWLSGIEKRHMVEASPYGYCAEVLIEGQDIDVDSSRETVLGLGDSVLVVGDERLLRIHVHTDDPGAVLTHGTSVGALLKVKIDNINRQAEQFVERHQSAAPASAAAAEPMGLVSVVAVASGEGLAEVFLSSGCARVVSGGPTMNPSTQEILEAIESCPTDEVIVLPNDKNIILAAEQALDHTSKQVRVVPSRSVPQGIAALLATNPEEGIEENAAAMEEALPTVRTIEITRSVRTTSIKGVAVKEGQAIAVVDDELRLGADSPEDAAVQGLAEIAGGETSLISLYYGAETTAEQAGSLAERLREAIAGHEVEVFFGGQPHYQYIISLE
jgi:DAK2 domain fusion protein YloV